MQAESQPSSLAIPVVCQPSASDICLGRGKCNWCHPGNIAFRSLISRSVHVYRRAPNKTSKSNIVDGIVYSLKNKDVRFLEKGEDGKWYEIGKNRARTKVSHSLRDHVHALQVQSKNSSDMKDLRRERKHLFDVKVSCET